MLAHARPFKHQSLIPDCETLEDDTLQALDVMEVYLYVWVFLRSFFLAKYCKRLERKTVTVTATASAFFRFCRLLSNLLAESSNIQTHVQGICQCQSTFYSLGRIHLGALIVVELLEGSGQNSGYLGDEPDVSVTS